MAPYSSDIRKNHHFCPIISVYDFELVSLHAKYNHHEKKDIGTGHCFAKPNDNNDYGTDQDYQPAHH